MSILATHIFGSVFFQSSLDIEAVGSVVSTRLFSGTPFGGLDDCVYEEVPAIYISGGILGFLVIIQEQKTTQIGVNEYCMNITPGHFVDNVHPQASVSLNLYLFSLFMKTFEGSTEIFSIRQNVPPPPKVLAQTL
jgi:hypothetical protein